MKTYLFILIGSICLLLSISCNKSFGPLNIDPNSVNSKIVQYEKVFSQVELTASGNSDGYTYEDERSNLAYCSLLIQHFSSTFYPGDKYSYNDEFITAFWSRQFTNPMKNNVDLVINLKNNPAEKNLYNIGRIFKAFLFQRMTDLYGDIPYSQAGLGYSQLIKFPVYDKQQAIYADLLNELDDAASKLDEAAANTLNAQDIIFGGDVSKWKKFAYSEMARLAMRMTKVDPVNAQKWIMKAYTGGAMTLNSDNAIVSHIASPGVSPVNNGSGYVLITQDNQNFKMSKTFIDFFKNHNDPRLRYYATVTVNQAGLYGTADFDLGDTTAVNQQGMPNGLDPLGGLVPVNTDPAYPGNILLYSIPNRYLFAKADAPTFFLTAAETQFYFAEAAERGWLSGGATASIFYQLGLELSFSQLIQTGADWSNATAVASADAYLTQNPYNSASGIQQINEQYWVTVFMDEYEAFANWRRTGFPTLIAINYPSMAVNKTGGTIPRRFTYPKTEVSINNTNYSAASALLSGGDKLTSRMWWDKL